jgi:uncharacterized protein (DUF736 family)
MIIGKFKAKDEGRIGGELQALLFGRADLTFQPNDKGADYTVIFTETGTEAGAAWKKTSEKSGKPYISVRFDSPVLSKPFNAALFPSKEQAGVPATCRSDRQVDGNMLEIDGIHESSCRRNQTHSSHCTTMQKFWTSAWLHVRTNFQRPDSPLRSTGESKPSSIPERVPKTVPSS